jgi:predicted nucleic acid-binding protein
VKVFLDTNILVYAQQADRRSEKARSLIAAGGSISVQVMNELTNVLSRKFRRSWDEIVEALEDIADTLGPPSTLTIHTHSAAVALARDHGFSFYDALIVAAAIEAGCDTLLSEDLQHGRIVDGLTIRNPFAASSTA